MNYFKINAVLICILIIGVAILFPIHEEGGIFELSLTVTPVLFAIFTGFSISERLSRVDKIRENDSIERSSLETLNNFIKFVNSEHYKAINKLIDEYLMATLDYSIWDYHKTKPHYERILAKVYSTTNNKVSDFGTDILQKMLEAREQTVTLINDRLSKLEWLVYSGLGGCVLAPFLLINNGSISNILLIFCVTLSITLLLYFLQKLDSLEWKKEVRIFEPYQRAFEAIGSMRYFPEDLMSGDRIKKMVGNTYRVGHFSQPYPNRESKSIEIHHKKS